MHTLAIKPFVLAMLAIGIAFSLVLAAGQFQAANAVDTTSACEGVGLTTGEAGCGDAATAKSDIGSVVKTIVDILSIIVGAASVIVIIISGLRFITSGGDSSRVASSRNTLLYAVVGLVIVLFAQVIVRYVVTEVDQGTTASQTDDGGGDSPVGTGQ
jgi:hypothetical protein